MLFVAFIRWWYGEGWIGTIKRSKQSLVSLAQSYSIGILLKTLFSPWKQISTTRAANGGLNAKFGEFGDRLISRFVGFAVRSLTLTAAWVSLLVVLVVRTAWIIFWPVLPLMVPITLLYGLGMF